MNGLIARAWTSAQANELSLLNVSIFVVLLAVFWWQPATFRRATARLALLARTLERHPVPAVIVVALLPLLVRLVLLPSHPIPLPNNHDEFSYLLQADTFAHGRVTNASHPLWQFFESFHVLPNPTYMSKYPPMQGLFLAAGQVVLGHPWWGVALSITIMVGSVCWMLQGWLRVGWALLGALAVGLQFGIGHPWMNSYWGGAPAAIGACLVLGAVARLMQFRPCARHLTRYSLIMAVGIAILLNSRPWEGLAVAGPATIAVLWWVAVHGRNDLFERVRLVLFPGAAVLGLAGAAMLYYNWRGTGDPLRLPYMAVHETYSVAPLFLWQSETPPPQYRHAVMKRFYLELEPHYQAADTLRSFRGWLAIEPGRLRMAKDLLFGNFFILLCLLYLPFKSSKPVRFLLATLGIFVIAVAVESWNQIHYFAPVIGLAAVLKMSSLRRLSAATLMGKRIGLALTLTVIICGGLALLRAALVFPAVEAFPAERARVQQVLEATSGSHVVMVRYSTDHPITQEWVYNQANIDNSKVVWARYMSEGENEKIFNYFKGRRVWLLEPDVAPDQLKPLRGTSDQSDPARVSLSTEPVRPAGSLPWQ